MLYIVPVSSLPPHDQVLQTIDMQSIHRMKTLDAQACLIETVHVLYTFQIIIIKTIQYAYSVTTIIYEHTWHKSSHTNSIIIKMASPR